MGALAEMERELIVERTRAGLAAARERGRTGGRPRRLTQEQYEQVGRLLAGVSVEDRWHLFLISAFQPFIVIILRAFRKNKTLSLLGLY